MRDAPRCTRPDRTGTALGLALSTLALVASPACGRPGTDGEPDASRRAGALEADRPAPDRGTPEDEAIGRAVLRELRAEPAVSASRIDLAVDSGVVTLSGEVGSLPERRRAVRRAGLVRGVRAVVDRLGVPPDGSRDEALLAAVRLALGDDPATRLIEARPAVSGGAVTLRGVVGSHQERRLVERVAADVRGVVEVHDELELDLSVVRRDPEIQSEVAARIAADRRLAGRALAVAVERGRVVLSGAVASAAALERAETVAWVVGVRSVEVSSLVVDPGRRRDAEARPEPTDEAVATALGLALRYEPRVSRFEPRAEVRRGVATLSGTVDSVAAREAAEAAASSTVGVHLVRNRLIVRSPDEVTDQELETRVPGALSRDPYLGSRHLAVRARGGRVFLHGSADSEFERRRAGRVAGRVNGVHVVENRIRVRQRAGRPEEGWAIERDIRSAIGWDSRLEGAEVEVDLTAGVASLRGAVPDLLAYRAAVEQSYRAGAARVVADLVVRADCPRELCPGGRADPATAQEVTGR